MVACEVRDRSLSITTSESQNQVDEPWKAIAKYKSTTL
jgi:hypothetical protein